MLLHNLFCWGFFSTKQIDLNLPQCYIIVDTQVADKSAACKRVTDTKYQIRLHKNILMFKITAFITLESREYLLSKSCYVIIILLLLFYSNKPMVSTYKQLYLYFTISVMELN